VRKAREALLRLGERWRALGEKGTISLTFRPRDPERGFDELLEEAAPP
jgi:hypothetical protein